MLATDAHTTTGVSSTPGSYQYNPTSPTGLSYQPGSVQNNTSTTYTQSRRIKGYTPLTIQWRDTDEPEDFVVIKKDKDWVVIYVVEKSASIQVDFEQDPIIVKGARLRDSSRRASQDSGQPTSGAAPAPQPAVQPAPVAIAPVIPAPGLKTWQMAVNTNPPGAIIQAYDGNQELYQIGKSPAGFLWPLQTQADALVVIWQGRQVSLLPTFMESISVDFSQHPPVVKGGAVIDGAQK